MEVRILTDLTVEPVTLTEVKDQLAIDYDTDDDQLSSMIKAARQYCEEYTQKAFGAKTVDVYFDAEDTDFELPIGPFISLTSITRTVNGSNTTLTTSDYLVYGRDYPRYQFNKVWTTCGVSPAYHTVVYQAGYADGACPEPIKQAIVKLTAELYENKENSVSGTIIGLVPNHVRSLLSPYRRNVL